MKPSVSSSSLNAKSQPSLNVTPPPQPPPIQFDEKHFVLVKGGTFTLGSDHFKWANVLQPWEKPDRNDILPVEPVNDFILSKYLVTFGEYDVFCADTNRPLPNDQGWGRGRRPVVNVTWLDAIQYCNYRSRLEGLPEAYTEDGRLIPIDWVKGTKLLPIHTNKRVRYDEIYNVLGYRLPTDIEWEYAAKGGPTPGEFQFIGSNDVDEVAWYKDNTKYSSMDVGLKKPNELGLYDMAGNVYEYCTDGKAQIRVLRGGGWSSRKESMRPSYKNGCRIDEAHSYVGFRICRSVGVKMTVPDATQSRKL